MEKIKELENIARQLEPDTGTRHDIVREANAYVEHFVESLPGAPGYTTGEINKLRALQIGEEGKSLEQLIDILKDEVDATGINSASGRHMGYIPGGGLWTSAVADMLAAAANRYAGIAYSSPGAVEIGNQMIRWLASVVGYPEETHGNLTSGGSIANLIAIKAARDRYGINASNVRKMAIYFTEQVHHCIHKALHTTGLYEAVLRSIPVDGNYRMDVIALRKQIEEDKREGLHPFLIIATAGTTDTGAIDPLDEIADIRDEYGMWFHLDAAYGGFFVLVEEAKARFKGMERSDSVVMDPHKTLFMPYGSGVVLIRDRNALLASNSYKAAYMKDAYGLDEIDPADSGPELSRHFRGLRMWLPLHLHGVAPFRANLEEKLMLCRYFHKKAGTMGFETGKTPDLSVAIFRIPDDPDNRKNEAFIKALHEDGRVFLSSTTIGEKLWIRCAVVSFRTHLREMDIALDMIRENRDRVLSGGPKSSLHISGDH
ncbi:pyridoxal phosphate-dependent decarboxylase family protein [Sinomicrobium weinanense]|nr:aminotransferase class V-fold PLP-dependent enzyme [Sinomicrobium weinanense]